MRSRRCAGGWACTTSAGRGAGIWIWTAGTFANKTKHGNHNRWLWEHAGDYDVVMFVDPDHVPLPIMAERLLGYFRDPEVAFVVTPQFYGNQEHRITRWAESAQYLFHSVIQRAGNRRRCPMLVGTNAAVRTSAIRHGYVDSITEDMATSLKIHATRNEGHREHVAVGLHAGPRRGRRRTELVDCLLRPADALVGGNVRRHNAPGLAGIFQAPAGRHAALRPDADLLSRRSPSGGSSVSPSAPATWASGSAVCGPMRAGGLPTTST